MRQAGVQFEQSFGIILLPQQSLVKHSLVPQRIHATDLEECWWKTFEVIRSGEDVEKVGLDIWLISLCILCQLGTDL